MDRLSLFRAAYHELLAAVVVVGRDRERRIGHDVHRQDGDVGGSDDAPDRERGPRLLATLLLVGAAAHTVTSTTLALETFFMQLLGAEHQLVETHVQALA